MKILAPLRSADEVAPLCEAGADEFYCGWTPPGWVERFGGAWIHRRNPASAGMADEAALRDVLRQAAGRPVYLTLNAPSYPDGALAFLADFGQRVLSLGIHALIVADMELLLTLRDAGLAGRVHLSSLATCVNPSSAAFFRELGVGRIILPRHVTLEEIGAMTEVPGLEIETFLLNDGCVFEEGLCATTHAAGPFCLDDAEASPEVDADTRERYALWKWGLNNCGCIPSRGYQVGPCGLCALPRLHSLGVASLKVVGREASLQRKVGSVSLARMARDLALAGASPQTIRQAVWARRGAEHLCQDALLCYYPDIWREDQEGAASCCA
jgi:putative protease